MAIRSRKNQYKGINAHLHSYLQNEAGGWEVFHGVHITHLAEAIDAILPDGYLVEPEKSLQIRAAHPDTGEALSDVWKPRPDLTVYDLQSAARQTSASQSATHPVLTLPAVESIDLDEQGYLRSLAIMQMESDGQIGEPITWIELLSPTNKPPYSGARQYREKRNATIRHGIALVEMDYLHETRSPIMRLPVYPDDEQSYPYSITVTNPRPSLTEGVMDVYGFHVDDSLPEILIPLSNTDGISLDLSSVYERSFSSLGAFSYRVDYEQPPINLEHYSEADQARIQRRMVAIAEAVQRGDDLNNAPFPVQDDS